MAQAHYDLGAALEKKGDLHSALDEYRAAYEALPNRTTYQEAYQRLVRRLEARPKPKAEQSKP
jgi:tetratricopeptide (TPR) repeat protein